MHPLAHVGLDGGQAIDLLGELVQVVVLVLQEAASPHALDGLVDANEEEVNPAQLEDTIRPL